VSVRHLPGYGICSGRHFETPGPLGNALGREVSALGLPPIRSTCHRSVRNPRRPRCVDPQVETSRCGDSGRPHDWRAVDTRRSVRIPAAHSAARAWRARVTVVLVAAFGPERKRRTGWRQTSRLRLAPSGSPLSAVVLEYYGGAASRIPGDATAFPHRDLPWDILFIAQWTDPDETRVHRDWARAGEEVLREAEEVIYSAFGDNLPRLAAVKDKYDPTNFFRVNHNIRPGLAQARAV